MFKVKYVDSIMMLVRLDLNLIVSLFQHKCEVSETVSTTTLPITYKHQVYTQRSLDAEVAIIKTLDAISLLEHC